MDRRWLLLLAPLLALVASLTLSYLWNEDFWWYLSSGQAILEAGGIPQEDPFLYTAEGGIGWVYHSWLWTVWVAWIEGLAGLGGVVLFHGLAAIALVILLYTTARADRLGLVNALAVTLVLVTVRHRLCGKAEIASWILLVVFFRLLDRADPFTWRRGAILGVLMVLWANLHGGYPLGIFLAVAYSIGGWLETRLRKGQSQPGRPPIWLPALLFLLAIADPRMWKERLAPFGFVTGSQSVQPVGDSGTLLILEWRSPFDSSLMDPSLPWLFGLSTLAGLASFALPRRRSLPRFLFFLGMVGLGASAVRHLGGLALAAALVLMMNFAERDPDRPGKKVIKGKRKTRRRKARSGGASRPWLYPASCAGLALLLLLSAVALRLSRGGFEGSQEERFFTVRPAIACPEAAQFVLDHNLPGPIFNDYQLGAYLGYRLAPEQRVFIDSRVLKPSVVVDYTKMIQSKERFQRAAERYGFRTAILGNFSKTVRSPLGMALQQDPDWHQVYADPLAVIFVRRAGVSPAPAGQLRLGTTAESRVPFADPPGRVGPMAALQRIFLNDFPANYLVEYLAILGQSGRSREVVELATDILESDPRQPLVLRQRCAGHLVLGQLESAMADCAQAYDLRPEETQIAGLYVTVLQRAGKTARALNVLDDALDRDPRNRQLQSLRRSLGGR